MLVDMMLIVDGSSSVDDFDIFFPNMADSIDENFPETGRLAFLQYATQAQLGI